MTLLAEVESCIPEKGVDSRIVILSQKKNYYRSVISDVTM